jgi:hypothetical protein
MRQGLILLAASAGVLAAAAPSPARADAIDGNWCAGDGRSFTIQGSSITTPEGHQITGDYHRHNFAYVIPSGETDAGSKVLMILLNEQTVRITEGLKPDIWHRCDVVS